MSDVMAISRYKKGILNFDFHKYSEDFAQSCKISAKEDLRQFNHPAFSGEMY
jgi:hypothetical protein